MEGKNTYDPVTHILVAKSEIMSADPYFTGAKNIYKINAFVDYSIEELIEPTAHSHKCPLCKTEIERGVNGE